MSGNAQINRIGGEADALEVASVGLDVYACEINGVQISLKPGNDGACVLSADLGPLAEDDADALIGEMLAANYAFQGAAGATLLFSNRRFQQTGFDATGAPQYSQQPFSSGVVVAPQ